MNQMFRKKKLLKFSLSTQTRTLNVFKEQSTSLHQTIQTTKRKRKQICFLKEYIKYLRTKEQLNRLEVQNKIIVFQNN